MHIKQKFGRAAILLIVVVGISLIKEKYASAAPKCEGVDILCATAPDGREFFKKSGT